MRIHGAAASYIDVPQPKDDPFRGGPSPVKKNRKLSKGRSLTRLLSAPIRSMGKQLSKRAMKSTDGKKSKRALQLTPGDEEQGWIATATTFETDESVSPRSVETLETRDSTTLLSQIHQEEDEEECLATGTLRQLLPSQYLDMQAVVHERNGLNMISPSRSISQGNEDSTDSQRDENMQEEKSISHLIHGVDVSIMSENIETAVSESIVSPMASDIESTTSSQNGLTLADEMTSSTASMMSPHNRGSLRFEEDDEIDSMAPAVDFSFYTEGEDEDDDFTCTGRQLTPVKPKALLPLEIDVENDHDLYSNSIELSDHEHQDNEDDIISTTSSHNSYLQAIGNITASANSKVERATTTAIEKGHAELPVVKHPRVEDEQDYYSDDASDDEESFCVSFTPSNDLLLQAMEGASARAKIDIERATTLALSKINTATAISRERAAAERANLRAKKSRNRVLGFLCFLFLFFNFSGSSYFRNISSSIGIDDFQAPQGKELGAKSQSDLTLWVEKNVAPRSNQETSFEMSNRREDAHNVACVFKIGCLALGSI